MNGKEYQKLAARTLIDKPDFEITDKEVMIVWTATGLAGETGEVVDNIKKGIFHQHGLNISKIKEELGDVMWYLAGLCTTLDIDMSDVMKDNINKLLERYPNGYNSKDSKDRNVKKERKVLEGKSEIEIIQMPGMYKLNDNEVLIVSEIDNPMVVNKITHETRKLEIEE